MPFTVVPDKATGDVFTEQMWDTYVRDNGNWLGKATGAALAYLPTANQTITTSTWTKVTTTTELIDVSGWFDAANSRYIPQAAGIVVLTGQLFWTPTTANASYFGAIYKNGSLWSYVGRFQAPSTGGGIINGSVLATANGTTDYFELYAWHAAGVGQDVAFGYWQTNLQCQYLGTT